MFAQSLEYAWIGIVWAMADLGFLGLLGLLGTFADFAKHFAHPCLLA